VASILHLKMQFSIKFKKTGEIGSAKWSGYNAREIDLIDVPQAYQSAERRYYYNLQL
jgi:hypothetical protein